VLNDDDLKFYLFKQQIRVSVVTNATSGETHGKWGETLEQFKQLEGGNSWGVILRVY